MNKLVAVIAEDTVDGMRTVMEKFQVQADVFEWRLDYLERLDIARLALLREHSHKPVILTLRANDNIGEHERLRGLLALAQLQPDYMDIEHTVDDDFLELLHQQFPDVKIIRSFHDFNKTPKDIKSVFQSMQHPAVSLYKISTQANSVIDAMRMLEFVKTTSQENPIVAHCMGENGLISRVLGGVVGNVLSYAATQKHFAKTLSIPSIEDWQHIYRHHSLNTNTRVYALLGDPVQQSIGHQYHNDKYQRLNIDAVYVKIRVQKNLLAAFFQRAKQLPFFGFSVTTPLKEAVIAHMDAVDPMVKMIGAANTVKRINDHWIAANTDGQGVLSSYAKRMDVAGKRVLIVGAGGAAKAIAHVFYQAGVDHMAILNRSLSNAEAIASLFEKERIGAYSFAEFESFNEKFDIVINTVPASAGVDEQLFQAIQPKLHPDSLLMDIDYGHSNRMLNEKLKQFGCKTIPGLDMYVNQAIGQMRYWFGEEVVKDFEVHAD